MLRIDKRELPEYQYEDAVRTYNYMGRTCKKTCFLMWEKHCPAILPLFLQVILLCFCLFHFVAFLFLYMTRVQKERFFNEEDYVRL